MPQDKFGVNYGYANQAVSKINTILTELNTLQGTINSAAEHFSGLSYASVDISAVRMEIPVVYSQLETLKQNLLAFVTNTQEWESSYAAKWDSLSLGLNTDTPPSGWSFQSLVNHLDKLDSMHGEFTDEFTDEINRLYNDILNSPDPNRRKWLADQIAHRFASLPMNVLLSAPEFRFNPPITIQGASATYTVQHLVKASLEADTPEARASLRASLSEGIVGSLSLPGTPWSLNMQGGIAVSSPVGSATLTPVGFLAGKITIYAPPIQTDGTRVDFGMEITARPNPPRPQPVTAPVIPPATEQNWLQDAWKAITDIGQTAINGIQNAWESAVDFYYEHEETIRTIVEIAVVTGVIAVGVYVTIKTFGVAAPAVIKIIQDIMNHVKVFS